MLPTYSATVTTTTTNTVCLLQPPLSRLPLWLLLVLPPPLPLLSPSPVNIIRKVDHLECAFMRQKSRFSRNPLSRKATQRQNPVSVALFFPESRSRFWLQKSSHSCSTNANTWACLTCKIPCWWCLCNKLRERLLNDPWGAYRCSCLAVSLQPASLMFIATSPILQPTMETVMLLLLCFLYLFLLLLPLHVLGINNVSVSSTNDDDGGGMKNRWVS